MKLITKTAPKPPMRHREVIPEYLKRDVFKWNAGRLAGSRILSGVFLLGARHATYS